MEFRFCAEFRETVENISNPSIPRYQGTQDRFHPWVSTLQMTVSIKPILEALKPTENGGPDAPQKPALDCGRAPQSAKLQSSGHVIGKIGHFVD
jgi:hypothetical protein